MTLPITMDVVVLCCGDCLVINHFHLKATGGSCTNSNEKARTRTVGVLYYDDCILNLMEINIMWVQ